jgi:hypothetical protein
VARRPRSRSPEGAHPGKAEASSTTQTRRSEAPDPVIIQLPPLSSPRSLQRTVLLGPLVSATCGLGTSGGGFPQPVTPRGGYWPRLPSKCLVVSMTIGQPSTDSIRARRPRRRDFRCYSVPPAFWVARRALTSCQNHEKQKTAVCSGPRSGNLQFRDNVPGGTAPAHPLYRLRSSYDPARAPRTCLGAQRVGHHALCPMLP